MARFTLDQSPGKIWFTADTHFGHKLVARQYRGYGDPDPDTDAMNKDLLEAINETVDTNDQLFHLGDVSFMKKKLTMELLHKIKCKNIHLIKGNHDYSKVVDFNFFQSVNDYAKLRYKGKKIMMMHYPIEIWDNIHHGSYHFHGHSHGGSRNTLHRIDVGVDNTDLPAHRESSRAGPMRPHSMTELIDVADSYSTHPEFEDHHKITKK